MCFLDHKNSFTWKGEKSWDRCIFLNTQVVGTKLALIFCSFSLLKYCWELCLQWNAACVGDIWNKNEKWKASVQNWFLALAGKVDELSQRKWVIHSVLLSGKVEAINRVLRSWKSMSKA